MIDWNSYRDWLGGDLLKTPQAVAAPNPNLIKTDSRSLASGCWYLPLVGAKFDGHDFIPAAIKCGASGFFCSEGRLPQNDTLAPIPHCQVRDTLSALQKIAAGWRRSHPELALIALTGSAGKTTTKEMVATILRAAGPSLSSAGNQNNEIGVPLTLLGIDESHRFGIIEMGARHIGDISLLTQITSPNVVACLNVGTAHLGEFGSEAALFQAKMEMYSPNHGDAIAVFPADDPRIVEFVGSWPGRKISFGRSANADVRLVSEEVTDKNVNAVFDVFGKRVEAQVPFIHATTGVNCSAAVALTSAIGIQPDLAVNALKEFRGVPGRFQEVTSRWGVVIDDSYNANPESMRAGLSSLALRYPNSDICLVLGDMLELGDRSAKMHWEVGEFAHQSTKPTRLFTVGNMAKEIGNGAIHSGLPKSCIQSCDTVDQLIEKFNLAANGNLVIFLKASNGMQLGRFAQYLLAQGKG